VETNKDECFSGAALQEYAIKRYHQTVGENPILIYFVRPVDPKKPIRAIEVANAYRRQQDKMSNLIDVKLSDQDYLQFHYFVDAAIRELPTEMQGDYCQVAAGMLGNLKDKENFDNGILILGALYGGAEALAVKGILGRLFAFLGGMSYSGDLYMVNQMITYSEINKKIEAMCSQSHLHMPEICNLETIRGNSQSMVSNGVGLGISGVMSAFSLYGPAKRLIIRGPNL
jgi:hypothetical protein